AVREDGIYIDLADEKGRAVRVTAEGWKVLDVPPILFRRYSHQAALPEPIAGGNLNDLDRFLNIKSDRDRVLVKAWLVTGVLENIPRPGLSLYGAQGSAKTTTARLLRSLLDPSQVENLSFPRDPKEMAQILDHHAVPFFDNLRTVD